MKLDFSTFSFPSLVLPLFLLLVANLGLGQLCGGSLSDPIISIDFGSQSNSNYGTPLSPQETTYTYAANNNLVDGQYTITSNSRYGRPEWHNSPDHTPGDNNGNMLLVNASYTAGEFYKTRVEGLCENTLFEFSAWILNALPSGICSPTIPANVKFEIRTTTGSLLTSFSTGIIDSSTQPGWQQYGISFNTGLHTAVDVILINNGPGGCGNDLAIDDIEFKACGDEASIESSVEYSSICSNDVPPEIVLETSISGSVFTTPVLQWQSSSDGTTWVNIMGETSDKLTVSPVIPDMQYRYLLANSIGNLVNQNCSVLSEVAIIQFTPERNYTIEGDRLICSNTDLNLSVTGDSSITDLEWTLPDGSITDNNPLIISADQVIAGTYSVALTDEFGCTYFEQATINTEKHAEVSVDIEACVGTEIEIGDSEEYIVTESDIIERIISRKSNSCDSIITYNISAFPNYEQSIDTIACYNSSIINPDGKLTLLTQDVTFTYRFYTKAGCDSIVTKSIIVPQHTNIQNEVCEGEAVLLPNGDEIFAENSFVTQYVFDSKLSDCDSIVNYDLTVFRGSYQDTTIVSCPYIPFYLPNGKFVRDEGQYTDRFTSINGCDSIVNYTVQFEPDSCSEDLLCKLKFPNAISPNLDGKNDGFKALFPEICKYESYTLRIYNRWGELMHESQNPYDVWLPSEQEDWKVFLWVVDYELLLEDGSLQQIKESGILNNID